MEDVILDSVNFWVQIRGIPPALLSEYSIQKAVEKIGEVLLVEWKYTQIPKGFSIPKALVKVKVSEPLCPGFQLKRKNGEVTWVSFEYEKLYTFCYDCGLISHDRGAYSSKDPVDPELYGPWLKYNEKEDIPASKMKSPTATCKFSRKRHEEAQKRTRKEKEKERECQMKE